MKTGPVLIAWSATLIAALACLNLSAAAPTPTSVVIAPPLPTTIPATPIQPVQPTAWAEPPTQAPPVAGSAVSLQDIDLFLKPVVDGLSLPVGLANAGDGSGRLFVVEKRGSIRVVQSGQPAGAAFLNIQDRVGSDSSEQGLLGLAFHPNFAQNGWFFVNYTDTQGNTVISRFSVTSALGMADPSSETRVLSFDQPAPNHNGGHLAFGPDGYLYIGTGDGGGGGDTFGNGQNAHALLGKMLRIDVDSLPYSIPPDNPFVGNPAYLPEIWAIGLRNPWRYSFDRQTGDLVIADVGQGDYEEVNVQPASSAGGENYGWPIMEGLHCFPSFNNCVSNGLILPVAEYDHSSGGCSITGGYVYHGSQYPQLDGVYFYGDYCSSTIWGMARDDAGVWQSRPLAQMDGSLSSFGEDENGEMYLADMRGGVIYQLAAR